MINDKDVYLEYFSSNLFTIKDIKDFINENNGICSFLKIVETYKDPVYSSVSDCYFIAFSDKKVSKESFSSFIKNHSSKKEINMLFKFVHESDAKNFFNYFNNYNNLMLIVNNYFS